VRAKPYSQPMRYSQIEKAVKSVTRPHFVNLQSQISDLKKRLKKLEQKRHA
jgi:hypothetical protein